MFTWREKLKTRTQRRMVVADENDKSRVLVDGPAPDVRTEPARPDSRPRASC
jgi:hypothetical protein